MTELNAAYQRIDELTKALRGVRGELETIALYEDTSDEPQLLDCLNLIDEALAEFVR